MSLETEPYRETLVGELMKKLDLTTTQAYELENALYVYMDGILDNVCDRIYSLEHR
jgi:hypothetical protein